MLMALTLAGCGSDSGGSGDSDGPGTSGSGETSADDSTAATATPDTNAGGKKDSSSTPTLRITFKGDSVTPSGTSMKMKAGEPLKLRITADQPGEIHVHSTPEQEFEYDAGTSVKILEIKQPGVVDVESHDLDKLIVQLEVR
jgi:hypothetical protein